MVRFPIENINYIPTVLFVISRSKLDMDLIPGANKTDLVVYRFSCFYSRLWLDGGHRYSPVESAKESVHRISGEVATKHSCQGVLSLWPKKVADYRNDHSVLDFIFAEFAVGLLLSHSLSFQIVDLSIGESLGPDKRGELCIKGPQVMLSYKDLPEQTAETLDSDGWLHTGKCNTSYKLCIPYSALPISGGNFLFK